MAHHVNAVQQRRQRGRIPDVEQLTARRRLGALAVRGGQHRVDGDDVVARVAQRGADPRSDEAGRASQQNPHGSSIGKLNALVRQAVCTSRSLVT